MAKGIVWDYDEISPRLQDLMGRLESAVYATMEHFSSEVENYAKTNAPWTDRTSNARNTLSARAYQAPGTVGIVLYHQMPYGVWLEVRWSGAYAIIVPTIDAMGPEVLRQLDGLMERL